MTRNNKLKINIMDKNSKNVVLLSMRRIEKLMKRNKYEILFLKVGRDKIVVF